MGCGVPVGAVAGGDFEGDFEGDGVVHFVFDEFFDCGEFAGGDFDDEFVVDLEEDAGFGVGFFEFVVDAEHGDFDDVGGGALDGGVEGGAFGVFAGGAVGGGEFGEVAAAVEEGGGVAVFAGLGDYGVEVVFDAAESVEVVFHDLFGFSGWDVELLGESEGGEAVDESVGEGFDFAAEFGGDAAGWDVEDFCADVVVEVFAVVVGGDEARVVGEVGHDAHFDLGVVGGEEGFVVGTDGEGGADFFAGWGADGDVLEVGVGGGESAGGGHGLLEGGVDAAVVAYGFDESFEGGFHFLVFAVCEEVVEEFVGVVGGEGFDFFGGGGVSGFDFFGFGEAEGFEEDDLELFG